MGVDWDRFDPRAKLLFALMVSAALVAASPARAAVAALPLLVLGASVLPARQMWTLFRVVAVLWVLTVAANAAFVPGERWGPQGWGWFRPSIPGMAAGIEQGGRLVGLAALSAWLVRCTSPLATAASLEWGVRRHRRLRRLVHRATLPGLLALRVVPLFVDEARRMTEVDRLRPAPRGRGRELRRVLRLAPSWIVAVIERADHLAVAMTLRGYDPEGERGFSRAYRLGPRDWMLAGAATAVGAALVVGP